MKRFVAAMLGGAMLMVSAGAQSDSPVAVDPVAKDVDVEAVSRTITNAVLYGEQSIPYKKHHHVSTILNGLANVCMNIAQFIGGGGKNKQQAILGVVGTVFGTAAQLAGSSSNKQNLPVAQAEFELKVIALTDMVLDERSIDSLYRGPSLSLLGMIKGVERSARPGWIRVLLTSGKAKPFIRELLSATCDYLHQHAPEIAAFLRQRIREYLQREGLIHPLPDGTLQRADDVLVDAVSRTVMTQACDEVHNHLLADLRSEVLQRALVDRLPQHRSIADVFQSLNNLIEIIQQEVSWIMLYVYGAYDQFAQLFQTIDEQLTDAETTMPDIATVAQVVAGDVAAAATIVASNAATLASAANAAVSTAGSTTSSVTATGVQVDATVASVANDVAGTATTVATGATSLASSIATATANIAAAFNTVKPSATTTPDATTKTVLVAWQAD